MGHAIAARDHAENEVGHCCCSEQLCTGIVHPLLYVQFLVPYVPTFCNKSFFLYPEAKNYRMYHTRRVETKDPVSHAPTNRQVLSSEEKETLAKRHPKGRSGGYGARGC